MRRVMTIENYDTKYTILKGVMKNILMLHNVIYDHVDLRLLNTIQRSL